MQALIQGRSAIFDFDGGIPSAQAAAAIKFGLETVAGVSVTHFVGESVEVVCDAEGASLDSLLEALSEAGFPNGVVQLRETVGMDAG
jgi:hypothetical protein